MWTLTFAVAIFEWTVAVMEIGRFFDRLDHAMHRAGLVQPGKRMPYFWVIEVHPGGHGVHLHFLVDRRIPQAFLSRVWGLGGVWASPRRRRGSRREEARALVEYITKQFAYDKTWLRKQGVVVKERAHRYGTARGFLPRVVRAIHQSLHQAWDWFLGEASGEVPVHVLTSEQLVEWRGPPWLSLLWR